MDELSIKTHIASKTDVKNHMERLWTSIVVLNETVGLSESTMKELQAKISSKIAQCDRSIQDHEKLLSKNNCLHEWNEGFNNVSKCKKCGKYSA